LFVGTCKLASPTRDVAAKNIAQKRTVNTEMTTMADVLDPRHWRERAERTREKAEQFSMRSSRDRLLKIAEEYDRLAERAAERQEAAT
jgi:hypothetical protein